MKTRKCYFVGSAEVCRILQLLYIIPQNMSGKSYNSVELRGVVCVPQSCSVKLQRPHTCKEIVAFEILNNSLSTNFPIAMMPHLWASWCHWQLDSCNVFYSIFSDNFLSHPCTAFIYICFSSSTKHLQYSIDCKKIRASYHCTFVRVAGGLPSEGPASNADSVSMLCHHDVDFVILTSSVHVSSVLSWLIIYTL